MSESDAEPLFFEDLLLRIIQSEDINAEVEKETDEEIQR